MSTLIDSRRRFLTVSTTVVGSAGVAAAGWPFIASWLPSERALARGAPVVVGVAKLEAGQQITLAWQGKPVWVLRRTTEMLATLPKLKDKLRDPDSRVATQQPPYARNEHRSIKPEYLVVVALCTHLGCVPTFRPQIAPADLGPEWLGGYFCPCHGSRFDLSGRVFQGVPAPTNLVVPPYRYLDNTLIQIGEAPERV
jgi:ubiquinol-cytochrome c reductase iron-sulfur subunit